MSMDFKNRLTSTNISTSMLALGGELSNEQQDRLQQIKRGWNFYEGYHWEDIGETDKPQLTENYCRAFVNKFVSFEFGKGFTTKYSDKMNNLKVNEEGETTLEFVNRVWDYNRFNEFCIEVGQSKSITGDAWIQVKFFNSSKLEDPFEEHPRGMIKVFVVPTSVVFPEYDVHDKSKLTKVTIMYPIERKDSTFTAKPLVKKVIYKQVWTKDRIVISEGKEEIISLPNEYGLIPFVQIKNFPVVGKTEGLSDLEDIIPLNVELNMKKSNVSEIIDYHSAPVTVVFGAKVSTLEKGANKIWGGLPKDSRVQNLELNSDMLSSNRYIESLKTAMHEVGGIPEGALGGTQPISNTSGVALQFINMPLIEKTRVKRLGSKTGLELVTKMILLMAEREKLITVPTLSEPLVEGQEPEKISRYDFFYNEVIMPDTLPKDELLELQQIQLEMGMDLESKRGALERIGRDNIDFLIQEIDLEKKEEEDKALASQERAMEMETKYSEASKEKDFNRGIEQSRQINSGFMNGESLEEVVNKETKGANTNKED